MSTSPASAEFKVLTARIREIETALDQLFDQLDQAATAPSTTTLKDLLARRRELADQLADVNIQLTTLLREQIHKDRAEITKNLAETRAINAQTRKDLEDFYKGVLRSSANYANPTPIITVPIDAVDDVDPSAQNEGRVTSPAGGVVETDSELAVTSPRSKRKGMCLEDMMPTQDIAAYDSPSSTPTVISKSSEEDELRLPLATIPNIDALSPTSKRKHDVDVAEACLSGKQGGEASPQIGTPVKRLKTASHTKSLKKAGRQASTHHIHQVQRPLPARVGKDGRPLTSAEVGTNAEKTNTKSSASTSKARV
ncbi:hypothetical protein BDZ89DRAFT_1165691 [Hymenopellis radicata]|nr:hypothetical protein BDZ89DRAFT_1165691 [Hymenopellis radicata]